MDAENLCEDNQDQYTHDFGDNKFPYYKGNTSIRLTEELVDDENETNEAAEEEVKKSSSSKRVHSTICIAFTVNEEPTTVRYQPR